MPSHNMLDRDGSNARAARIFLKKFWPLFCTDDEDLLNAALFQLPFTRCGRRPNAQRTWPVLGLIKQAARQSVISVPS